MLDSLNANDLSFEDRLILFRDGLLLNLDEILLRGNNEVAFVEGVHLEELCLGRLLVQIAAYR